MKKYVFKNSATDNIIGHLTLPDDLDEDALQKKLNLERARIAVKNGIYIETIYWVNEQPK
jgi:hypothetical protein